MKKALIFGIALILLIGTAYAYEYISNPWTGKLDFINGIININMSGNNLTNINYLNPEKSDLNVGGTFIVNNSNLYVNSATGNVGIGGINTPTHRLNVLGDANITGIGLISNLTASDSIKYRNATAEVWRTYVNASNSLITEFVG